MKESQISDLKIAFSNLDLLWLGHLKHIHTVG
jgi:hypothetical protein